jgi:hypothetical protein
MVDRNAEAAYRQRRLGDVEGWLKRYSADVISAIASIQRGKQWGGAVGEIGVHHGKLFILLWLNAAPGERAFALDVFENQQLNIDNSGEGDREIFLRNVTRWCGGIDGIRLIAKSSLDVRPSEILSACGPVRLASIDGGHTEEHTINDLHLVERALTDHGAVIIDDCFNERWPGVAVGVAKYLLVPNPALVPFAISPNKVYFSRPEFAAEYRRELKASQNRWFEKQSSFFGHAVDIYGSHLLNRTIIWHVRQSVRRSPLGPYAHLAKVSLQGLRKQMIN